MSICASTCLFNEKPPDNLSVSSAVEEKGEAFLQRSEDSHTRCPSYNKIRGCVWAWRQGYGRAKQGHLQTIKWKTLLVQVFLSGTRESSLKVEGQRLTGKEMHDEVDQFKVRLRGSSTFAFWCDSGFNHNLQLDVLENTLKVFSG